MSVSAFNLKNRLVLGFSASTGMKGNQSSPTHKLNGRISAAEFPQADKLAVNLQGMIGNCTDNIGKMIHGPVKTADDHGSVSAVFKTLSFLKLRLDTGTKTIVNRSDYIDSTVSDLVNIGYRTVIHRMDEGYGKLLSVFHRKNLNHFSGIPVFQD